MGDKSGIEWTDATWNPVRAVNRKTGGIGHYCRKVSRGCRNCYAERTQPRFRNPVRYAAQDRDQVELFLDEKTLLQPLRWTRPRRIFVCSTTDLFLEDHEDVWIDQMFAVMALCPRHTFQVLTKRSERMREYLTHPDLPERISAIAWQLVPRRRGNKADPECERAAAVRSANAWPLPNVLLGASVEDQEAAEERIPDLMETPAALRFLSAEPLLGPLDVYGGDPDPRLGDYDHGIDALGEWWEPGDDPKGPPRHGVDWIIAGGESGPDARPSHPDWFRSLRDQCQATDVPFFFKQWGEWLVGERTAGEAEHNPHGLPIRFQDGETFDVVSDGHDILLAGAEEVKEGPELIWREFGGWRGQLVRRVGKKAAGRELDGREWDDTPTLPPRKVA